MAKIITANGAETEITPKDGKYFSLEECQAIVDGYIEVVNIDDKTLMICNEEGHLHGLPLNRKASELYNFNMLIRGTVLICDDSQMEK